MYQIYVYIYVENFRSFAHLLHTPVRRLMKSVYDNSVGATAMCSLRCAHTPPVLSGDTRLKLQRGSVGIVDRDIIMPLA